MFELWRDRYDARQAVKAVETPARLAALWAERDELFTKRAAMPQSECAEINARLAALGREIAELAAPQRDAILDLVRHSHG